MATSCPPSPQHPLSNLGRLSSDVQKLQPPWAHRCVPGGGQGPSLAFQKGISKELLKDTASKPHTSTISGWGLIASPSTRTTSWVCTGQGVERAAGSLLRSAGGGQRSSG